mmetsp:Transcript_52417/g.94116  ORF Transcript_52417/g.94116 Transcript_52417/m.94116 type:complete len:660 (+) Transcript_52417:86-2065(+)
MIEYDEDWLFHVLFRTKGSLAGRSLLYSLPSATLAFFLVWSHDLLPDLQGPEGWADGWSGPFWSASTASLAFLIGFRTNQAWKRFWEGTSLLHQMRGEWFDSVSCAVTFSRGSVDTKPAECNNFRHTLVRLMSLCHGSALEEISGESDLFETIDTLGLDNVTLKHIKACKNDYKFNRVEVLLHMTQTVITKALADGVITIPPPILSRVYQTLSRGFVNLLNAKKIADTRFPFPWAQLMALLLFIHALLTPCVFASFMRSKFWAPLFTWISTFAFFYLEFVGIELENPFGSDSNDLPLQHFQEEMNSCLVMLLQGDVDLVAHCDMKRAELCWRSLQDGLSRGSQVVDALPVNGMKSEMSRKTKRVSDFVGSESEGLNWRRDEEDDSVPTGSASCQSVGIVFSVGRSVKSSSAILDDKAVAEEDDKKDDTKNGENNNDAKFNEKVDEQVDQEVNKIEEVKDSHEVKNPSESEGLKDSVDTANKMQVNSIAEKSQINATAEMTQTTDNPARVEPDFSASRFELPVQLSARVSSVLVQGDNQQAAQGQAVRAPVQKVAGAMHSQGPQNQNASSEVSVVQPKARWSALPEPNAMAVLPSPRRDSRTSELPRRGSQTRELPRLQRESQTREPQTKAGNAADRGGTNGLMALPEPQQPVVQSNARV